MILDKSRSIFKNSLQLHERRSLIDKIEILHKTPNKKMLNAWKLVVGETSDLFFKKRLEWSDISSEEVPYLINDICDLDLTLMEIPDWLYLLDCYLREKNNLNYSFFASEIPFYNCLLPLVGFFSTEIPWNDCSYITKTAQADLENVLLQEFSRISSQSHLENFRNSGLDFISYEKTTVEDNSETFFLKYPSLARLIFVRGCFWINNTQRFLDNLQSDAPEIANRLCESLDDFEINKIVGDLSESHNEGKNVFILTTCTDNKFLYKQRSIECEKLFYSFLDELNDQKELDIFHYVPWLIGGPTYGWMEFIEHKACGSNSDVKNYFENLGSLLAMFYILGATDLHSENLISYGKFPVFIDLETLFNAPIKLNYKHINDLNAYIDKTFGLSVSRIGILPQWLLGPDTNVYDNSALMGNKSGIKYPQIIWKKVNSDSMYYEYSDLEGSIDKNILFLNKEIIDYKKYSSEIISGFTNTYKHFLNDTQRQSLAKTINSFRGKKVRFVFRATKVYTLLLEYLNHPDYMKNGVVRSIQCEVLAKGLLNSLGKKYRFWKILDDELFNLSVLDIPYYSVGVDDTYIASYKGKVYSKAFEKDGITLSLERLRNMDEEDLKFQVEIIKGSLKADKIILHTEKDSLNKKNHITRSFSDNEFISIAEDIANQVISKKLEVSNRATWVSYVSNVVSHTFGYKPIGVDLANGNLGVAVFFSALYSVTRNKKYLHEVSLITQPVIDILSHSWAKKEFVFRFGTGGTTGLGSLIYGFSKIYSFTGEDKYLKYAFNFSKLVTSKLLSSSLREDIVSGNAGLLLALVHLYNIRNSDSVLKKVHLTGDHLVSKSLDYNHNIGLEYQQGKVLTGFSHGTSGVLYALSKYYPLSNNKRSLIKVFAQILSWEKSVYSKEHSNWPDYRGPIADYEIVSWCHGAVGIGMSRLKLLDTGLFYDESILDISNAYKKTINSYLHHLDTVCCGNSGRIDFLLELLRLGIISNKFSVQKHINFLISNMLGKHLRGGNFSCFSKFDTDELNVGYYQGVSGIGYELLRLIDPQKYRSIILFD